MTFSKGVIRVQDHFWVKLCNLEVKSIFYLPSDCRVALTANISKYFNSTMGKDQTTTPGSTLCPTLYDECVGSLTSLANHNSDDEGDVAYGLLSLSEKTWISNHLQMSLQRQYILLSVFSYFKFPSSLFTIPEQKQFIIVLYIFCTNQY